MSLEKVEFPGLVMKFYPFYKHVSGGHFPEAIFRKPLSGSLFRRAFSRPIFRPVPDAPCINLDSSGHSSKSNKTNSYDSINHEDITEGFEPVLNDTASIILVFEQVILYAIDSKQLEKIFKIIFHIGNWSKTTLEAIQKSRELQGQHSQQQLQPQNATNPTNNTKYPYLPKWLSILYFRFGSEP